MYNHKLILWNEGRLPDDFTIETLLGKHPSRPFNKNVADIFFKAGFIEAWGRGIAKITNGFKNEGLKIPTFETTMGGIMVTIDRPNYNLKDRDTNNVTDNVTDKVADKVVDKIPNKVPGNVTNKVTDKVADKVADKVVDKLTNNQKSIIEIIKINPYVSARELAPQVGISHRKIQENMAKLKEYGIIERIGSPKGGHWKIIN